MPSTQNQSNSKRRGGFQFLNSWRIFDKAPARKSKNRGLPFAIAATETLEERALLSGTGFEAHFDFGTEGSPVAGGYQQVLHETNYSAARGYGWQSGSIDSRNRSASFGDDLSRDFNFTQQGTFAVDGLANGTYDITLVMGDGVGFMRDQMGIFLEGQFVDSVTASAGNYAINTYRVTVTDGQLNVMFQDLGGADSVVTINAMEVVQVATVAQDQTGPQIVSIGDGVDSNGNIDRFQVEFSEAIDPASVSLNAVNLYGPSGLVTPVSYNIIDAFTVEFVYSPLTVGGEYVLTVIPNITDLAGNFVDQDGDGVGGELGDDFEVFDFEVEGEDNLPPSANAGGGYSVNEGGSVQLDATGSTDPEQDPSTLSYEWDLDGDGIFGETGADAANGDENGAQAAFSAANLSGSASFTVTLRVTDSSGAFSEDTAVIDVQNVAPEVTGLQVDIQSNSVSVSGNITDAGVGDVHTVSIDWGDGTTSNGNVSNGNGGNQLSGNHVYQAAGTYQVTVTVTDDDGAATTVVQTVTVVGRAAGVEVIDGTLHITGTDQNDRVVVRRVGCGYFKVTANFLPNGYQYVSARGVDRIHIETFGGNDRVKLVGNLRVEVEFDGGEGCDRLHHRGRWHRHWHAFSHHHHNHHHHRFFGSHAFHDLLHCVRQLRSRCR